jgi:hypothetical protein
MTRSERCHRRLVLMKYAMTGIHWLYCLVRSLGWRMGHRLPGRFWGWMGV